MCKDISLFILCLPFSPFIYLYNLCFHRKVKEIESGKKAKDICEKILEENWTDNGYWASNKGYTDVWTRDSFFSLQMCEGDNPQEYVNKTKIYVQTLERYQRGDGLIPLFIGTGDACCKLFCCKKPSGEIKPQYTDVKTGDTVTDSCFQYIILKGKQDDMTEKAWEYMQKYVKDGLIYEEGLGSWMDTVKHKGHVLYTNMLYYRAAHIMKPELQTLIKDTIIKKLWGRQYFKCSTDITSFDQVGNALAMLWGVADENKIDEIKGYRQKYFNKGINNPPCLPLVRKVFLPCYALGNYNYHNYGWSWVNLLFMYASKDFKDLGKFTEIIKKYDTIHEIYSCEKPVNRLFCESQPDFSEAAGMYLLCEKENSNENPKSNKLNFIF
jgi:hypothetical protein